MKQEQYNHKTSYSSMQHSKIAAISQELSNLKATLVDSWFALGNLLLLIGGDDSVEIGMKFHSIQILNPSVILLTGEKNSGQSS
jgi:hypothetical protein